MTKMMELLGQEAAPTVQAVITRSLIGQAQDLSEEHELFHEQYIVGGRKALYAMLAKILGLVRQFEASADRLDLVSLMRQELAEKYGIRTQDNTSYIAVIVRYITRADRKTTHVYARAIESALESGTQVEYFPAFLEHHGGIERIRSVGAEDAPQNQAEALAQEKIDLTLAFLRARTEVPFASFTVPKQFVDMESSSCEFEHVICCHVGSEYRVVGKLPAELDVENYAIRKFSTMIAADIDTARTNVAKFVALANEKKQERIEGYQQLRKDAAPESKLGIPQ
jgi:hypothetical protein